MYYGLEASSVNKSQTKSFQYVVNCCFGKMLNVRSKEDIEFCMQMLVQCPSVELTVAKRIKKNFERSIVIVKTRCALYLETELAVN